MNPEPQTSRDEALFEEHTGLIYAVARRFLGRGTEFEDLVQIGAIGLLRAIRNFDPARDVRFSTYAVCVITGEIRSALRENTRVKLSRKILRDAVRLKAAQDLLGEDATIDALCRASGVCAEDAALALGALDAPRSLDEDPVFELSDPATETDYTGLLDRMCVEAGLRLLDQNERRLILLRYYHRLSQEQTGKLLHMTQVQISRAEKKILQFLKQKLA